MSHHRSPDIIAAVDLLSILLIALGLSMDCLAVAIAGSISMQGFSYRQALRTSLSFGFFQFGMLILGWLAGKTLVDIVGHYDHWVAFALLSVVGARMIWEARSSHKDDQKRTNITEGIALITLSVATSIDALAVGLSLAFLKSRIMIAALIVGGVAFLVTGAGFYAGRRIGTWFGRWATAVGGVVLIGIGVRILVTHLV